MKTILQTLGGFGMAAFLSAGSLADSNPADYVAHEWGTFTTVQGDDGEQMRWNPVLVSELPEFVYSLAFPNGKKVNGNANLFGVKTAFNAIARLETPVIYFYSTEPRKVDVAVEFPEGKITEWYPQASRADLLRQFSAIPVQPNRGFIQWKGVEILPNKNASFPRDISGNHYYAARETSANPIRVTSNMGSEVEKFLFYRGVADFQGLLSVKPECGDGEVLQLENRGKDPLLSLYAYAVVGDLAVWTSLSSLAPGEKKQLKLRYDLNSEPLETFQVKLAGKLRSALVTAGLYEDEAAAMVKTWEKSWLGEQGVRVLYILPRAWTDQVLPLQLSPSAREVARVMVGRAEIITANMEEALLRGLVRFSNSDANEKTKIVQDIASIGLGRFAEPAMRRVLAKTSTSNAILKNHSRQLLDALYRLDRESAAPKPIAQK